MNNDSGGPAFPIVGHFYGDKLGGQLFHGMTLRDYFAAEVLPAVYKDYLEGARLEGWADGWRDGLAGEAYEMADAMLKARTK